MLTRFDYGSPGAGSDVFARLIADLIRKEKLVAQPIVITMARNLMEPVYMKGAEYGRYLAARQPEFARFIADVGLASTK